MSNTGDIIKRIRREYPHIRIFSEAYTWTSDECCSECGDDQCSPEMELSWNDLFADLEKIGIVVVDKKDLL